MNIQAALLLAALTASGSDITEYLRAHYPEVLTEYITLLRIPNVAADTANITRNVKHIREMMERRGVKTQAWELAGASPVIFGELPVSGATQTLVFYAHYDGQPVNATQWAGAGPFDPQLRSGMLEQGGKPIVWPSNAETVDPEWRLYARSASDDKAPIQAMMTALDALKALGRQPRIHLKFVLEGEEEAGSTHLGEILNAHRGQLSADAWMICDGPVHQTRRQQVYFGARGVVGLNLTVYGPIRELHSGHYGNWAPNPAMEIARLLASMKDEKGRVLIKGFYDGVVPLSQSEQEAIEREPPVENALMRSIQIGATEGDTGQRLSQAISKPSLNVRGIQSGAVGSESRNAIPSVAVASLDLRLVKGNDWLQMIERVKEHIRGQGYFVVDRDPDEATRLAQPRICRIEAQHGYNAVRTSMDLAISIQVVKALEAVHGPIVQMPTLGGSVPLSIIEPVARAPMIGIPIVNHDNNQHSANENLRIANLWQGIETFAALFEMAPAGR